MRLMSGEEVNALYYNENGESGTVVRMPRDSSGERDYVSIRVRKIGMGALSFPLREYEISGIPASHVFEHRGNNPTHEALAEPVIVFVFDPSNPNGIIGRYTVSLHEENKRLKKQVADLQLDLTTARQEAERSKAGVRQQMAADNSVSKRESLSPSPFLDRW